MSEALRATYVLDVKVVGMDVATAADSRFRRSVQETAATLDRATVAATKASRVRTDSWAKSSEAAIVADKKLSHQIDVTTANVSRSMDKQIMALRKTGMAYKEIAVQAQGFAKSSTDAAIAIERAAAREVAALEKVALAQKRVREQGRLGVIGAGATRAGERITGAGSAISSAALPVAAVAGYSIKLAADYQKQMEMIHTQAGATQQEVDSLTPKVLKLGNAMGQTGTELAKGLFHIESAGFRGAKAMDVLRAATMGAKVGGTDMESVSNALVATINSQMKGVHGAADAMGQLNAIVGQGNMRMNDMTAAISTGILPKANQMGLSLRDVGAALDVMTSRGVPAQAGATRLGMTFALMLPHSTAAVKAFQEIGLNQTDLATKMRGPGGLASAVQLLKDHLNATFPPNSGHKLSMDQMAAAITNYGKQLDTAGVTGKKRAKDMHDFAVSLQQGGDAAIKQTQVLQSAFGGGRTSGAIMMLVQNATELKKHVDALGQTNGPAQLTEAFRKSEETMAARMEKAKAQFTNALISLGQTLGPIVLPILSKMATLVTDAAQWFGKLPGPIKTAGVAIVGLGVALGPILWIVGNLTKAFGGIARLGGRFLPESMGGRAKQLTSANALLSAENVRLAETFDAVAISARAAAGAEALAAEAAGFGGRGHMGVGGLPPAGAIGPAGALSPAGAMVANTETAAKTGVRGALGRAGGMITSAGSALMRGGMIAGTGVMGAQLVGGMVGGRTGSAISTIGSGASIGAGIGSMIAPGIGTAIGAGLGAVGGALIHFMKSQSYGDARAGSLTAGFGGANRENLQKTLSSSLDELHRLTTTTRSQSAGRGGVITTEVHLDLSQLSIDKQAKALRAAQTAGTAIAGQLEAGWTQYKFQNEPIMFQQLRAETKKMPVEVRGYAAQSAIAFASGLESQGRLTKGSTAKLLEQSKQQFPGFIQFMGISANAGVQQFNKALDFKATSNKVKAQLHEVANHFPQVQDAMTRTAGTVNEKSTAVVKALQGIIAHGSAPMKAQATADLAALRASVTTNMTAAGALTEQKAHDMAYSIKHHGASAAAAADTNFNALRATIEAAMSKGQLATVTGAQIIAHALNVTVKAFGGKPIPVDLAIMSSTGGSGRAILNSATGTGGFGAGSYKNAFHATGGRVPGPVGPDNWTLVDPSGNAAGMVGGAEILIANRHTENRVDEMLAQFGTSLGAEVAGETRPHAAEKGGRFKQYATGGYVFPYGKGLTQGRTDMGTDWLGAGPIAAVGNARIVISQAQGSNTGWPGAGSGGAGAYINYQLTSGPDKGRYIYLAENIDPTVRAGQTVKAGQVIANARGQYPYTESGWAAGPLNQTEAQAHGGTGAGPTPQGTAFTKFVLGLGHGKLIDGGGGMMGGAPHIKIPHVKGAGRVAHMADLALGKMGDAANAYIDKHFPGSSSSSGPSGHFSGSLTGWLTEALHLTNHFSPGNLSALSGRAMQESAGNPRAVNNWDSNAKAGHPSKGLLQTIDSTFSQYMLPGHGDIWNPVDNAAAAIRYMYAGYGHIVGPSGTGYAKGGRVRGFDTGGSAQIVANALGGGGSGGGGSSSGRSQTPHMHLNPFTGRYESMTSRQASALRDSYIRTYGHPYRAGHHHHRAATRAHHGHHGPRVTQHYIRDVPIGPPMNSADWHRYRRTHGYDNPRHRLHHRHAHHAHNLRPHHYSTLSALASATAAGSTTSLMDGFGLGYQYGLDPNASGVTDSAAALTAAMAGMGGAGYDFYGGGLGLGGSSRGRQEGYRPSPLYELLYGHRQEGYRPSPLYGLLYGNDGGQGFAKGGRALGRASLGGFATMSQYRPHVPRHIAIGRHAPPHQRRQLAPHAPHIPHGGTVRVVHTPGGRVTAPLYHGHGRAPGLAVGSGGYMGIDDWATDPNQAYMAATDPGTFLQEVAPAPTSYMDSLVGMHTSGGASRGITGDLRAIGQGGSAAKVNKAAAALAAALGKVGQVSYETLQKLHDTLTKQIAKMGSQHKRDERHVQQLAERLADLKPSSAAKAHLEKLLAIAEKVAKKPGPHHAKDEKRVDQLTAELATMRPGSHLIKHAEALLAAAKKKAVGSSTASAARLGQALQLVDYQMGERVGAIVKQAEDQAGALAGAATRMQRMMARQGIDAASEQGLQMLANFNAQAEKVLRGTVDALRRALQLARRAGNKSAIADITSKLGTALDQLDQAVTDRIVSMRDAITAHFQHQTDQSANMVGSIGGTIQQRLALMSYAGSDQTAQGGRDIAAMYRWQGGAIQGQISDLQKQQWWYAASGQKTLADQTGGQVQAAQTAYQQTQIDALVAIRTGIQGEAANQAAWASAAAAQQQQQIDALNAIKTGVESQAQSLVDAANHAGNMASIGMQALSLNQQLAGTDQTASGHAQMASYIQSTIIPSLQGEMAALQQQQASAQSVGDQALASQIAEAIASKQNDVLQAQLDAQNAIKSNTQQMANNVTGTLGVSFQGQNLPDLAGGLNGI